MLILFFQKLPWRCDKPVKTPNFGLFVQTCLQIGQNWWQSLWNSSFLPIFWPITVTKNLENAAFGWESFANQICQWRSCDTKIKWAKFTSLLFHSVQFQRDRSDLSVWKYFRRFVEFVWKLLWFFPKYQCPWWQIKSSLSTSGLEK